MRLVHCHYTVDTMQVVQWFVFWIDWTKVMLVRGIYLFLSELIEWVRVCLCNENGWCVKKGCAFNGFHVVCCCVWIFYTVCTWIGLTWTIPHRRDSSVGRASDWRSEGPWFDPGLRQIHCPFFTSFCPSSTPNASRTTIYTLKYTKPSSCIIHSRTTHFFL